MKRAGISSKVLASAIIVLVVAGGGVYYFFYLAQPSYAGKTLRVMTWGGDLLTAAKIAATEFTKQTGANVTFILHSGGSAAALAKFAAETPDYETDVYFAAPAPVITAAQKGYTVPLTAADIPNLANVPDLFKMTVNGQVYGIKATSTVVTWGYRTDFIKGPINAFADLLNPAYKGKLAIPPPTFAPGRALTFLSLWKGGSEYNIAPGFTAAQQIATQGLIGTVYSSDADMTRLLSTGQAWAVLGPAADAYEAAKAGAPVAIVKGFSDTKLPTDHIVLSVLNTPQKALAMKFVNAMLDPKINGQYASFIGDSPNVPGASISENLSSWTLTPTELVKYSYPVNDTYISANLNDWNNKWETTVLPLVKPAAAPPLLPGLFLQSIAKFLFTVATRLEALIPIL